jgi:curved DNA-binding protein CbpA
VRHDPTALILAGFKRYATPELVKAQLAPLAKGSISRHPDFDRALFTMRSIFQGETLTPMINGRLTVGEVLAKARPDDLPLFSAIVSLSLCVLVGVEVPKKLVAPVATGPAHEHTAEEDGARSQILPEYERVMASKDLFGVLRLQRDAPVDECKASYLALAKRFHADAFAGLDLGDATEKLSELFAKISEAHSVLTDSKRRADYLILLERQDAGLPTDVDVIFKAEAAFNRGDALAKQGRFSDAEAAFKEALKLDTSVAQYHVGLAHAILKGRGASGAAEARAVLDKSLALNPEHVAAMLLKAQALELEGDPKAALKLISDVLAIDPASGEAGGLYKALRDRMKKGSESKGLLGKLFGR